MSTVLHVNEQTFETEVLKSPTPVVIDFYATWCAPCRALGPILDRLAEEFSGRVKFVKVNSDEEAGLSTQFNVTGLPTMVFIEGGENVGQFSGLPQESDLRGEIINWLESRKVAQG